jgi:hypothetical protein
MQGKGTVNLGKQLVNYRLWQPVAEKDSQDEVGQGLSFNRLGVSVPIIITGSFDKLYFKPDVQSAIDGIIKNPDAIKQGLESFAKDKKLIKKNLKKALDGGLQQLLKGF